MRNYPGIALQAADVLIPNEQVDMSTWSVVACDQYTAEPEYWSWVEEETREQPSTYHLILPETYLGSEKAVRHQEAVNLAMRKYLERGIFREIEGFIYVEREISTGTRKGLIAALDLEQYDFQSGSATLIRATEGTIVDRLPPRIAIRKDAPLEIPHILVLIDDPGLGVIEPLSEKKNLMQKLYEFDLMQSGGHLRGYLVNRREMEERIVRGLNTLKSAGWQAKRYGTADHPLLYAVGDGNHSLATAKSVWEMVKSEAGNDHPARYALVELVNLHDPSILFEPIHRLMIKVEYDPIEEIRKFFKDKLEISVMDSVSDLQLFIKNKTSEGQRFGLISSGKLFSLTLKSPPHTLAVGSVQEYLDAMSKKHPELEIDYIHGDQTIQELGSHPGNVGIMLPAMDKFRLFESVIKDGPLPRKTFSMGEAQEKRYYLECRRIK